METPEVSPAKLILGSILNKERKYSYGDPKKTDLMSQFLTEGHFL